MSRLGDPRIPIRTTTSNRWQAGGGLWYAGPETTKPSGQRLGEGLSNTVVSDAVNQLAVACPVYVTVDEDGCKTAGLEAEIEVVGVVEPLGDAFRTDQPRTTI